MFYVVLALVPIIITAYFVVGRQLRVVPLRNVDPALVLQGSKVNVKKTLVSNILLGVIFGLVLSLLIFIGMLGSNWYNSTGLFAVALPFNTYPPKISDVLPPHPPSYAANGGESTPDTNSSDSQN